MVPTMPSSKHRSTHGVHEKVISMPSEVRPDHLMEPLLDVMPVTLE